MSAEVSVLSGPSDSKSFLFVFGTQFDSLLLKEEYRNLARVKAQLGVRKGNGWLSLYDGTPDKAYAARMENLEILKAFAVVLGRAGFYSKFDIEGCRYGRYLFGTTWSLTERYLMYRRLLEEFFDRHRPATLTCVGLAEAHPVDLRALRAICLERRIGIDEIIASDPEVTAATTDFWKGCAGAYAGFGRLGEEYLFFRQGDPNSLNLADFPIQPEHGGLMFDRHEAPAHCDFAVPAPNGIFASLRFRYLHLPGSKLRLQLAANGKAISIIAGSDGWYSEGGKAPVRLGPAGPMYPGQNLLIHKNRGFLFLDGMPAQEVPLIDIDIPDGLRVSTEGAGECYAYLDRILIAEASEESAGALSAGALSPFFAKGANTKRKERAPHLHCVSLFHPTPCVSPPVDGCAPMFAPFYQDGWTEFGRHGIHVKWISAQEPWRLDGKMHQSGDEIYLYRPIDIDFAPLREEWLARLIADFHAVEQERDALVAAFPNADFVDFFLASLRSSLPTIISIAGDLLRMQESLSEAAPDVLLGARLDNSFPWAVAAAKSQNIPCLSSEISFIYHEIHRIHLLAGESEMTDAISVWGQEHKRRLESMNLASPAVHCGGLPALDLHKRCPSSLEMSRNERDLLAAYLGFRLHPGPVVLYGGWFGGRNPIYDTDEFHHAIATLLDVLKPLDGNIIIKSISMDDPLAMRAALDGLDLARIHILHPQQPFHNAYYIALADLHVALPTTMLAESLAQGCPTLTLWTGTHSNWYPVSDRQIELLQRIMPVAKDYEQLARITGTLLRAGNFTCPDDGAFRELFGSLNEDSTARLARLAKQIAHKKENFLARAARKIFFS